MVVTPWQNRARYIQNSPVFFLDHVQTRRWIVQGHTDETAHRQQADEVFAGLRRLGKEVQCASYAGESHCEKTWSIPNLLDYWSRVIGWFDPHLKPRERPTSR
jgi:dipeptidyl aminopeptidase/acylaminoacyl peptidase